MTQAKEVFKTRFTRMTYAMWGKQLKELSRREAYETLVAVIRGYISEKWIKTNQTYAHNRVKQVYYFSIEFLLGRLLKSNLLSLDLYDTSQRALAEVGIDIDELLQQEPDAGLGNGGLGRLAACFIDSLAAMSLPGHGCGIRYRFGLFEQKIINNNQVELPDAWLQEGFLWEYRKADKSVNVSFYGNAYMVPDDDRLKCVYEGYTTVFAVPYDVPIIGYHNNTVNTLRLWNAEVKPSGEIGALNYETYRKKMQYKYSVQEITKILYPDDSSYNGRLLRLKQEYFFVSAGIQSILQRYFRHGGQPKDIPDLITIHINDTHPALAVAEIMRILMDDKGLGWDTAWLITKRTIAYTNHTILPEALETWPIDMMKNLLPRIYMIIDELNRRLVLSVREKYRSEEWVSRVAILYEGRAHMARLAFAGSYSVNGVAKIHTEILRNHTMKDLDEYYGDRINNKTNGITHRRWLIEANPELTELINESIGTNWQHKPELLIDLLSFRKDAAFKRRYSAIKVQRKKILAKFVQDKYGIKLDIGSIFDVQIKRIHSYKRQIMNVLHIMSLYNCIKEDPDYDIVPRTFIFGGKAAPGYYIAKQTIKLINMVANIINNDKVVNDRLRVVFVENYGVSLGQLIFPAANVSEQISTASKEASGTGNMKFMMNGAITLGTLDGANVEIREAVTDEHCVIFGLKAEEVLELMHTQQYSPWDIYNSNTVVRQVMEQLVNGFFHEGREDMTALYDYLLNNNDEFFVLKDFAAYAEAQKEIERRYVNRDAWAQSSIVNVAYSGRFSSDRTIDEYARDIWRIKPIRVK